MTAVGPEMIVHKATRECPMIEPHPREICGLVKARRTRQGQTPPGESGPGQG
jgi:hypothetical protein